MLTYQLIAWCFCVILAAAIITPFLSITHSRGK